MEVRYTDGFAGFCQGMGLNPMATSIAMPNSKGKVESVVRSIKHNALVTVRFDTLDELNAHLAEWCRNVADHRVLRDRMGRGTAEPA